MMTKSVSAAAAAAVASLYICTFARPKPHAKAFHLKAKATTDERDEKISQDFLALCSHYLYHAWRRELKAYTSKYNCSTHTILGGLFGSFQFVS